MSSGGYTVVFQSVFDGTLYGKWPACAVWLTILSLCDKNGHVDMSYEAISGRTGWPLDLLRQGIEQLCTPDPTSRSPDEEGRRLVPIDPSRPWGWKVVNHSKYREKARLMSKDAARTASGEDAARKQAARDALKHRVSPAVPRRPPESPAVPLSDANANAGKKESASPRRSRRVPADFQPDLDYARHQLPGVDAEREAQKFRDYEYKTAKSDWSAAWRNWVANCRDGARYARLDASKKRGFVC